MSIMHMPTPPQISMLDLASLITSRICHDIISPVGAIVNGLEIMEDDPSADMKSLAMDLIKKSAEQASIKLQFSRLAFGMAGSMGGGSDSLEEAEKLVRSFMKCTRADLEWNATTSRLPRNTIKLLLNMIVIANDSIPGKGLLSVSVRDNPTTFTVRCTGEKVGLPKRLTQYMLGEELDTTIDVHLVQFVYTGILASTSLMEVSFEVDKPKEMVMTARSIDKSDCL